MENKEMTQKINDILIPFSKEIDFDKIMSISFGDDQGMIRSYTMTQNDYIHSYYLRHLHDVKVPVIEIIYDNIFGKNGGSACTGEIHVDVNNYIFGKNGGSACTGEIHVDVNNYILMTSDKQIFYLNNEERFLRSKIYKDYPEANFQVHRDALKDFVKELRSRVKNINCKGFTSLSISIIHKDEFGNQTGHKNILFITKDFYDNISIYLYEPHGHEIDTSEQPYHGIDKFLRVLAEQYNELTGKMVYLKNRVNISCPNGLQKISMNENGFCIMFSYLWLYVVLNLIKSGIRIDDAISYTEEEIINYSKPLPVHYRTRIRAREESVPNAKKLMTIILNFSMKIVDIYVEHLLQNPDDELKKFFEKGLYETKRDISRFSLSTKTARTHKPRYESRTVKEIEATARGEYRSRIGDKCFSNRDCESEYCLEGKCAEDLSMYD